MADGELLFGSEVLGNGWLLFGDAAWADYDFQARVLRENTGTSGVSLLFRSAGPGVSNAGLFNLGMNGNQRGGIEFNLRNEFLVKEVGGVKLPAVEGEKGRFVNGKWHALKVEVRGTTCRCLVDGEEIAKCDVVPEARGRVGLRVGRSVLRFRDVLVTAPDGTVLWNGLPDLPPSPKPVPAAFSAVRAADFTPLFNGTDTAGWALAGPKVTRLTVGSGEVHAVNAGPGGYVDHLVTTRADHEDGVFRCQFKLANASKTAEVMVRVDPSPIVFGGMRGYLVEACGSVPTAEGKDAALVTLSLASRVRGKLVLAKATPAPLDPDRWHDLEVATAGNQVSVVLNGERVIQHADEGRTFLRGAAALQFRPDCDVRFRRIEYQEKPPAAAPPPAGDTRARWVHQAITGNQWNERWAVYQSVGGGKWVESMTDLGGFTQQTYTEVERTKEYVELERPDGGQKLVLRLYDARVAGGPARTDVKWSRDGSWK